MDKRRFLKKASMAVACTALPLGEGLVSATEKAPEAIRDEIKFEGEGFALEKGSRILFFGDSITDASRERKYYRQPNSVRALGSGYVQLVSTRLCYMYPDKELKIYNAGINGDTVAKLMERLQTDCLALRPDVVSILIGVNDFNMAFTSKGKGNPKQYEKEYKLLLTEIRRALPDVRFIIGEPYAVQGSRDKTDAWYPEFNAYPEVARRLAEEFDAVFVPYQSVYAKAAAGASAKHFSTDGVHPSLAGIRLMSDAWLSYVNPL